METRVTLVEWPRHPIQTVFYLWEAARNNESMPPMEDILRSYHNDPIYQTKVRELFEKVVDSSIPIAENLNFVFLLEGVSISFREQMVRHKIGVKVGERLGVDSFPDLHDSTWWAQSMRVLNMGEFADKGMYRIPDSIANNPEVIDDYKEFMGIIQEFYSEMLEKGVPIEDAREVIPLGAQHRISWGLNLSSLMHVAKKRSCWIPQVGTWEPVIKGMVRELVEKVDPYFASIVTPPCIKGNTFQKCVYELDNERRVDRSDPLLPCSLYMHQNAIKPESVNMDQQRFSAMEKDYADFWQRDVHTGKRLQNTQR